MKFTPFKQATVFDLCSELKTDVKQNIFGLNNEYVMKCSVTELEDYYVSMVKIDALILHTDDAYILDQKNTPIKIRDDPLRDIRKGEVAIIPGPTLEFAIPYEGNPRLWHCEPSDHTFSSFPDIALLNDRIVFSISFPDDSASKEKLKSEVDAIIASFAQTVNSIREDLEKHNASAPREVETLIRKKRGMAESVIGAVSALGIPKT